MSEPNELERLRADLEVIDRYNTYSIIENARCDIIAKLEKLEAEQADPWREAKEDLRHVVKKLDLPHVGNYVRYIESDNAKQAARIAELEHIYRCELVDGGAVRDHLRSLVAELEANAKTDANTIAGLRLMIEDYQARPVPPLDPKRVIATACKILAENSEMCAAAWIMQTFKAGDAGIYPLAGDET